MFKRRFWPARGQNGAFALALPLSTAYHEPMLNVTLNDKTAKLLESYRRSKRLSREKALEALLEDVMQRQTLQATLLANWTQNATTTDANFEADLTDIIKRDRAKQRARGSH
jgi:hypothetical protein